MLLSRSDGLFTDAFILLASLARSYFSSTSTAALSRILIKQYKLFDGLQNRQPRGKSAGKDSRLQGRVVQSPMKLTDLARV